MLHWPDIIIDQELVMEMLALLLLERNNCHNKHIWYFDVLPHVPSSIILFRISCLCKIEADAIFLAHVKINTSQATKLHKNHHLLVCVWSGRLNNVKIWIKRLAEQKISSFMSSPSYVHWSTSATTESPHSAIIYVALASSRELSRVSLYERIWKWRNVLGGWVSFSHEQQHQPRV